MDFEDMARRIKRELLDGNWLGKLSFYYILFFFGFMLGVLYWQHYTGALENMIQQQNQNQLPFFKNPDNVENIIDNLFR